MNSQTFWHVIWTTHGCWPPAGNQGDWRALDDFYSRLCDEFPRLEFSNTLPKIRNSKEPLKGHVQLNDKARVQARADVLDLATRDRVAGNTPVFAIAVEATCVQLAISCEPNALSRRVGRLKSRTATLLSFNRENGIGGANTWGKGFWYARFYDEKILARVVGFVGVV